MKYFLDTEFIEGSQTKRLLSIPIGKTKPTIDLISIGIVAEDGREYYAISKDFNFKEAWYRWQQRTGQGDYNNINPKEYWIRENVLKPIWKEYKHLGEPFTYKGLKNILSIYGKTNKQIAREVKQFIYSCEGVEFSKDYIGGIEHYHYAPLNTNPKFYGYYSDYDWVVFCWLFGRMIDLPKGFPMYCNDLKQQLDRKLDLLETYQISKIVFPNRDKAFTNDNDGDLSIKLERIKTSPNYPKQTNEHNALADAHWNKKLYEFLNNI